ncbi:MAG: EamA family transporter [SAR86 cluster bacterium]|uniref:EamA family transporter n=1 Tax=SAR86 cluster bacterium TaxID=2030880 RepID=A0A2A4X161_9GAMM|nr:MAG: EamA family transporter [SAR86 cluster bacterium]
MHNPKIRHTAGFFLSLIAAMLWGMLPVALKELLSGMDAITIVWYRFFVAGVVLFAWLAVQRKLPQVLQQTAPIKWFLLIAAIGLCINYFLFSYSLNFVNGETSEAVIQLTTLFLILGGVFVYKEPFFAVQKFGTLLIMLGLLLFFNDRLSGLLNLENRETIGVIIVVFAAITWTVYALLQKQLLNSFSSVQILFLIYAFSIVVLLPFISPLSLFELTEVQFYLLLFCCLNTIIAYGCFAEALNCWDASKVSAVLALAPLFTIGSLKLVVFLQPDYAFSDRLSMLSLLGALLLVVGSALTALMPVFQQYRANKRATLIEPV